MKTHEHIKTRDEREEEEDKNDGHGAWEPLGGHIQVNMSTLMRPY